MWYCTRYFKKVGNNYQLLYKWINVSENESLVKEAELIYQYEGWQVTRIEELEIEEDNYDYLEEYPSVFAIYSKVPMLTEDDRMNLDTSDIQTIKIGRHRYKLKYYNNEYVYSGDIPEGIPILIYLNTELKVGYLPYIKPLEVNLPLVSELPVADYSNLGKRVLYKTEGVDEYPCLYYCTQVENELGGFEFKWLKPREPNPSSQVMEIEFDNNIWKIIRIGDIRVDEGEKYRLKVSNTLVLTGRVPSNSVDNQKIKLGNRELAIRYLDGSGVKENDIIVNSIISIQINLQLGFVTISSTPQPIEFDENKLVVKVANSELGSNGRWKITRIGDIETTSDYTWKSQLPDKLILIVQIPSNSVGNQIIEIGSSDYTLNYISGVSIAENDFKKDTILTIYGSLSSNKLYIPAFPSGEAQQLADFTNVNNRIDLEIQNRQNLGDALDLFKSETLTNFVNTNNSISKLRGSINDIVAVNFAPIESPTFYGTAQAPTPTEGDVSQKIATTQYVMTAISNLINSSPESLNTLAELSQAMNNDPNFAATIAEHLSKKLDKTGGNITGTLVLLNNSSVLANQYNRPALVIGGTQADPHLEIGANQIQSKEKENSSTELIINDNGGLVIIGSGGLRVIGDLEVLGDIKIEGTITSESTIKGKEVEATILKGTATSAEIAYNIPTEDVGGNIWLTEGN